VENPDKNGVFGAPRVNNRMEQGFFTCLSFFYLATGSEIKLERYAMLQN
jgi:hypothetical protein